MCCKRIVLPVRGGATINARWPLPRGVSRSITRVVKGVGPVSSFSQILGIDGRELVEGLDVTVLLGLHAVDVEDLPAAAGLAGGGRAGPCPGRSTPSRRPNFSIMLPGTKGSVNCRT